MVEDIEFREILVLSTVPDLLARFVDEREEGFGQVGVLPFFF